MKGQSRRMKEQSSRMTRY